MPEEPNTESLTVKYEGPEGGMRASEFGSASVALENALTKVASRHAGVMDTELRIVQVRSGSTIGEFVFIASATAAGTLIASGVVYAIRWVGQQFIIGPRMKHPNASARPKFGDEKTIELVVPNEPVIEVDAKAFEIFKGGMIREEMRTIVRPLREDGMPALYYKSKSGVDVRIVYGDKDAFGGDEVLFPELTDGTIAKLEGELVTLSKHYKYIGLRHEGRTFRCFPEEGSDVLQYLDMMRSRRVLTLVRVQRPLMEQMPTLIIQEITDAEPPLLREDKA